MIEGRTVAVTSPTYAACGCIRRAVVHPFAFCLYLVLITLLLFSPALHYGFISYDDPEYVTDNPRVRQGITVDNVRWAMRTTYASNWHPLTWLSHMLDTQSFGKGAAGPHAVNLALHAANAALLFLLFQRMTGALWRSAFVAALFAWHPLHVESVVWIAERKDLLSTLFGMLALLAYARYAEKGDLPSPKPASGPGLYYVLALVLFAFALMSKPMLVTLPFVMLLLDFWPLGRWHRPGPSARFRIPGVLVWEKVPFFLLSVGSCAITVIAQKQSLQPLLRLSPEQRVENALVAYARYLGKTVWPTQLALPYPHPGNWPWLQVAVAGGLLAVFCVSVTLAGRRFPFLVTGWFWFLGTLVPVIGLVQVGGQAMADRYTYLPLVGLFILGVWGAAALAERVRWCPVVVLAGGTVALVVAGFVTRHQVNLWRDDETLFGHAAAVTKNNYVALGNIGVSFFDGGRFDEAIDYYRRSLQINPDNPDALNNMGAALAAKGEHTAAVGWFRKALERDPAKADAQFNLGNALANQGKYAEAIPLFEAALANKPERFEAHNNLANTLLKLGRIDEARTHYELALRFDPDAAKIHKNLAAVLLGTGKVEEAVQHYHQALSAAPADASTHYSLGLALAIQAQWAEAIQEYNEALRLGPSNPEIHYNLGYAFRVQGALEKAATQLNEALRLKADFPLAHFNLGCVLADQGQPQQAVVHLKEALRLQPDYPEATEKLRTLTTAVEKGGL